MKKKYISMITALMLAVVLTVSQWANVVLAAEAQEIDLEYLRSVMEMIKDRYKDSITDEQLIQGALNGMFDTMDKYTDFYPPDEAESFLGSMEGSFGGIGIAMEQVDGRIMVSKVFPASPAFKAGLQPGYCILSVNGTDLNGKTPEQAASLIKGDAGTKVRLKILKQDQSQEEVELTRAEIRIDPVTYRIEGDIGYICIETFNANTAAGMENALIKMDSKGIEKIILDLRNNPGGYVDQAVEVARCFVPKGLITRLEFKSELLEDESYYSYLEKPRYKLAVLVNEMSASASEILAGAIQDSGAGTLIGTKTFGKGKVQNLIPILTPEAYEKYSKQLGTKIVDGYELMTRSIIPLEAEIIGWTKITTGEYVTPKGRRIDGIGLTPDKLVQSDVVQGKAPQSIIPLSRTVGYTLGAEGMDIYSTECILQLLGYDVGTPDTKLDEKTCAALKIFQKENHLWVNGVLTKSTQLALNVKLEAWIVQNDKQYQAAEKLLRSK